MKSWTLIKSLSTAAIMFGLAPGAHSTGDILEAFLSHYKLGESSAIGEKSCSACHISDDDLGMNPYGLALQAAIHDAQLDAPTAATWKSLEATDADGDGTPTGEEIVADTLPGDPKSGGKAGVEPPPPVPKKEKPLVPKNAWHPAVVHFPIALFIGGLILDFLGMIRKDKTLLQAGWYNIIMAAITALAGIASGVFAMTFMKLPYRGLIFNHLIWAVISSALIWILVALRMHRHEKINLPLRVVYYIIATVTLITISWAGHLGGEFVYG